MYKSDIRLEAADMHLRMFVMYCNELEGLYEKACEVSAKLNKMGVQSPSYDNDFKRTTRELDPASRLMELLYEEEKLWTKYSEKAKFCNEVGDILQNCSDDELNLLYLRYEKRRTFRQIGDETHYSHTQIWRKLDDILEKFV